MVQIEKDVDWRVAREGMSVYSPEANYRNMGSRFLSINPLYL